MFSRVTSATWLSLARSWRIAPKTFGVSVFTLPPRISGAPDHCEIGVTAMPASVRCFAVPPVERISTPLALRTRARSVIPVLSETERMARSMLPMQSEIAAPQDSGRTDVAAGLLPDEVVEVDEVGDGARVGDGGDAKGRGFVVEVRRRPPRSAAEVFLGDQRI